MKIAIGTCFFAKGNVNINSGHLTKIRYKNDLCTKANVFIKECIDHEELKYYKKIVSEPTI